MSRLFVLLTNLFGLCGWVGHKEGIPCEMLVDKSLSNLGVLYVSYQCPRCKAILKTTLTEVR